MAVKFQKDAKGNITKVMLTDVQMGHIKTGKRKEPILKESKLPWKDVKNFQNSVMLIVDEDTADEISEVFPDLKIKKVNTKEKMLERMSMDDPSKLRSLPKYYTFNVSQKLQKPDGTDKPLSLVPKVFHKNNGKAEEVTWSASLGNGCVGNVMCNVHHNREFGSTTMYLGCILLTDMITYSTEDSISDLLGDLEVIEEELPKAIETVEEAFDKDKKTPETEGSDEFDEIEDDIPF